MKLDDPELVQREYADEHVFDVRRRVFTEFVDGANAADLAFAAVAEAAPDRVLEVGPGPGEFSARILQELGADIDALDLSPRMVELTRSRGVRAVVGDAQALPFPDAEFDCVVANWMLYHVPDRDRALSEIVRVLRAGGRFVAATFGRNNLRELWALLGEDQAPSQPFSSENGGELLERHFARVERCEAEAVVVFPGRAEVAEYVQASIRRRHLLARLPDVIEVPFRARSSQAVFVAEKAS